MTEAIQATPPRHTARTDLLFAVDRGVLCVGGQRLPDLAETIGHTPFFAYDRTLIAQRIAQVRACLAPDIRLHYSVKANPLPALLSWMRHHVDGFDVASGGELLHALDSGCSGAQLCFAGPGKTQEELTLAMRNGVLLHVESAGELKRVLALGQSLDCPPQISIRVNPDFELKASGMKMGGGARPFGVDAEAVPALLSTLEQAQVAARGLHLFAGSQNLHSAALVEAFASSLALAERLLAPLPERPYRICLGAGWGIPYFAGEARLDMAALGAALDAVYRPWRAAHPAWSLTLEMGRFLVGEAGVYCARILDRKVSRGETFLVLDGGMHHHLAASGNFGQVLRKNFPLALGARMLEPDRERVQVVGPLCTPLDVLGRDVWLPRAEVGEWVVVLQSGAYAASASPQAFLSHPPAQELLL